MVSLMFTTLLFSDAVRADHTPGRRKTCGGKDVKSSHKESKQHEDPGL